MFSMQRVEALLAVATSDAEWGAENKKSNKHMSIFFHRKKIVLSTTYVYGKKKVPPAINVHTVKSKGC